MSERTPSHEEPGFLGRALVERLVSGRLPGFLARYTHRRLSSDPVLARHYDSLRRLERAAAGNPPVSDAQKQLLRSLLFEGTEPAEVEARRASSSWPRVGMALAGAAAAALLFVQIEGAGPPLDDEAVWTARGVSEASVGVRARCLSAVGDAVLAEAEAGVGPTVAPPELSCARGGLLALSATNRGDHDLHVFVVGLTPNGEARWLAPFDRDGRSVTVTEGSVDVVLGDLAALSATAPAERLALHALFARAPFSAREVSGALEGASRQGLELGKLARIPLASTAQARVDLVLRGGEEPP